ncbi:hypothetical protein [Duffyella gerundensis]|uniref:hypothetical protein n=1 Tax=Duffyella gerundensis TaxID=1619313 RepID=UPI003FD58A43
MNIRYKIRSTETIKKDNDVICFDYINELTSDYKATSFELYSNDRNEGYFLIFNDMLKWLGYPAENKSLFFYGELAPWLDDTKINRHKGFWGLKPYSCKDYSFLKEKNCVFSIKDKKIKLHGFAKLGLENLHDMIMTTSYKDKSFYFFMDNCCFDKGGFISVIQKNSFGKVLDYILLQGAVVFVLLGDEDFKSSEIVMIGNFNEIRK